VEADDGTVDTLLKIWDLVKENLTNEVFYMGLLNQKIYEVV
jgi:hypothetical protein